MMHVNQQLPLRAARDPEGYLDVHSSFHTIQGEGPFAGQAAYFVRLHGCNLQCPACDTEYTSCKERFSPESLCRYIEEQRQSGDLIVFTGGEPFRQNLTPATRLLVAAGYRVQVETNGTFFLPDFPYDHALVTVVCSPKTAIIHPKLAARVNAYKYVLEAHAVDPEDGLPTVALRHTEGVAHSSSARVARPPADWEGPIYLQPMDTQSEHDNRANAVACAKSVMNSRRYILGFQMHKYVNLP